MSEPQQTFNLGNAIGGGSLFLKRTGTVWLLRRGQSREDAEIELSGEQARMLADLLGNPPCR